MAKKYRVSVSYEFEAVDDVAAREQLAFLALDDKAKIKLQEIYAHKSPRSVILPKVVGVLGKSNEK